MMSEISDALFCLFGAVGNNDTIADCYLYLIAHGDVVLAEAAQRELTKMGRCPNCGAELQYHTHRELHDECDYPCYEDYTEMFCPQCDFNAE